MCCSHEALISPASRYNKSTRYFQSISTSMLVMVPLLLYHHIYLPSSAVSSCDFPRDRHGSNLPLHCIDLQLHNRHVKSVLSDAHSRVFKADSIPEPPVRFYHPASLVSKRCYTDTPPSRVEAVPLDEQSLHKLLRKATAATCAYSGYDGGFTHTWWTMTSLPTSLQIVLIY